MTQIVERTLWDGVDDEECLSPNLECALRTAYFSNAGGVAMRYRISIADVVAHLTRAGIGRVPRPERAADNLRCVVHAAALVRGDAQAWADIKNMLATSFDRACAARLEPVHGIAFARRFWIELRASCEGEVKTSSRAPDLRAFAGLRPLRYWLAERLLGTLEQELGRAGRGAGGLHGLGSARGTLSMSHRLDSAHAARTLRIPRSAITVEAKAR